MAVKATPDSADPGKIGLESGDSKKDPSTVKIGYKLTEAGAIPEEWECRSLLTEIREMTDFVAAGSFESLRNSVHVFDVPKFALYVRLFDLRLGLGHDDQKYVDEASYNFLEKSNLYGNEILVANIGANVGESFLMPANRGPATIAPNMIVVRANDHKVRYDFLYHYMASDFGQARMRELIAGSGHPKVSKTDLKKLKVLAPLIPEQRAIAEALNDVGALLDALDRLIAKKRSLKHAAMQQLLAGQTRLPGFHGKWEAKRLGEIAKIQRGASPRPIDSPVWFDESSSIGWVRISDVTRSGMFLEETTQRLSPLGARHSRPVAKGSLIMSICATVGRPIITGIDVCIHDGFVVFDKLQPVQLFVYYFLKWIESDWSKYGQTGSQMNLNTGLINGTRIFLPPLTEQTAIANVLGDIDEELSALEQRRAKIAALKQSMMQQLLTGRIRLV